MHLQPPDKRPGRRGPPKLNRGDDRPVEGGAQQGNDERLPHHGIQVPPETVKEGVRSEKEEEGDGDDSDVGAAQGAPGVNTTHP